MPGSWTVREKCARGPGKRTDGAADLPCSLDGVRVGLAHRQREVRPLTRAELRVAALAARGCVNRTIAERLFITPSTVEQHPTRVFKKLGITGRDYLPTWLSVVSREDCGARRGR